MKNLREKHMKKRLDCLLTVITAVALAACDAHIEEPDTAVKVGHVLCTDGRSISYESYKGSDKEAIAIVFYLNHDPETAMRYICMTCLRKPLRTVSEWLKAHRQT